MKKFGKVMGWILLVIVFLVGIALIFNEPIKNQIVKYNTEQKMKNMTRDEIAQNELKDGEFNFSKVKSISVNQVVQTAMQNDSNPLGKLAVPAVNMHLPILKGISDTSLSSGGGTMKPDQVMGKGNYALAGHYMTNQGILFSPLQNTQLGQLVYLTDLSKVYVYRITYKKIVDPHAVWLINDVRGAKLVTLITCADGGVNRWAIQGNLIDVKPANKQNLAVFD